MDTGFCTIQDFLSEYVDRTDASQVDEKRIMSWALSRVKKLVTEDQLKHVVALLPVKDYAADRPEDFHSSIQMAFRNGKSSQDSWRWHEEVVGYTKDLYDDCKAHVEIKCNKCLQPECNCDIKVSFAVNTNDDWMRANTELQYMKLKSYYGSYGLTKNGNIRSQHHPEFVLMKAAQHNYHGADDHIRHCLNYSEIVLANSPYEYRFDDQKITTNVRDGHILISYLAYRSDDEGHLLIPDNEDVIEALFWNVEQKMIYRYKKKDPKTYQTSWKDAYALSEKYYRIAKAAIESPEYDYWVTMMANHQKLVPYSNIRNQANRIMPDQIEKFR